MNRIPGDCDQACRRCKTRRRKPIRISHWLQWGSFVFSGPGRGKWLGIEGRLVGERIARKASNRPVEIEKSIRPNFLLLGDPFRGMAAVSMAHRLFYLPLMHLLHAEPRRGKTARRLKERHHQ